MSMAEGPVSIVELASAIKHLTGIDPLAYAAERVAGLATAGDEASLRRFREVIARFDPHRSSHEIAAD